MAVVPTYRPDRASLERLVARLQEQGCGVVVADDASPSTVDPSLDACAARGARVVRHARNAGIARSLNAGLTVAMERHAGWLLTVDQDSEVPDGYVESILAAADHAVAVLGPRAVGAVGAGAIDDRSGELGYPARDVLGLTVTEEVIQTGTLWSVAGLRAIGGFDESLGIDAVDAAACVRLRASGRHIVLAPGVVLGHALGDGRQVRLLGRNVLVSGHAPARRSTIIRNRLRLFPEEFEQSPVHALRTLRRVAVSTALALTIEGDRWSKAKASARGLLPRRDR